jgi:hypothetical protein
MLVLQELVNAMIEAKILNVLDKKYALEREDVCYPNGLISFRISWHIALHFHALSLDSVLLISHMTLLFRFSRLFLKDGISDENRFDNRDQQTLCEVQSRRCILSFIKRDFP